MSPSRLEKLKAMASRRPHDPFTLYGLAMEYKGLERYPEAAETFRALLDHNPDYTAAFLHYGRTLLELGKQEEAEQIYRHGIEVCEKVGADHAGSELQEALEAL